MFQPSYQTEQITQTMHTKQTMHTILRSTLAAVLIAILFPATMAQARQINFQGRLTDGSGNPVTGNVNVIVRVYDAETLGNLLYTETIGTVAVVNGVYSFQFGEAAGQDINAVLNAATPWVEVSIDGAPLTPRQRLNAVPFALRATSVDGLNTGLGGTVEFGASGGTPQTTIADTSPQSQSDSDKPACVAVLCSGIMTVISATAGLIGSFRSPSNRTSHNIRWRRHRGATACHLRYIGRQP